MPPFAVNRMESVPNHSLLERHSVFKLLIRDIPAIRMRHRAEQIEGASHVDFFSRIHIKKRQIDCTSSAVAGQTCDVSFFEKILFVQLRIKERLHAQIQIFYSPKNKMLDSTYGTVGIEHLQTVAGNVHFVANRLKGTGSFTAGDPAEIVASIKPWYDGYCFAERKVGVECVFNSDMTLYHLKHLVETGEPPKNMVDANIKTDYEKLKTISDLQRVVFKMDPLEALPMTEQAVVSGGIQFPLVESFPAEAMIKPENFRSLFFYYGLLSMSGIERGATVFSVPNVCVERQIYGYLRERYFPPAKSFLDWDEAARAFAYDGKWREFFELVAKNFAETTPIRGGISGEIRLQGYFQCEMGHLPQFITCPELELSHGNCDFFLFPNRVFYGDVPHSYIVEFKHVKKGAKKPELEAQRRAGIDQLKRYAKDKKIPALAKGTTLHLILVQYRGPKMTNCELVGERKQ